MKPTYKQVKAWIPHCPVCEEAMSGNNSMVKPYQCACGTWVPDKSEGKEVTFTIKAF